MIRRHVLIAAIVLVFFQVRPASADITAFIGAQTNPDRQANRGIAAGVTLVVIGFEGEYANSGEDESAGLPSLTTFMGNIFVQTPVPIVGTRFYFTTGTGVYRERLESIDHQETNIVFNTGGGGKIDVIGPLRVRLDYRLLKLQGDTVRPSTVHRIYAGVNLSF